MTPEVFGWCLLGGVLGSLPAVVLWGARVRPVILGYPTQKNIYTGNGKDCGAIEPCRHCAEGMAAITPDMVAERLKCALSA